MGQILDTVPNHMGVGTNDNPWWNDVLENGPASRYAALLRHRLAVFARGPSCATRCCSRSWASLYGDVLEAGQLQLAFADGAFFVHYGDRRFPVAPRSYGTHPGASARTSWSSALVPTIPVSSSSRAS